MSAFQSKTLARTRRAALAYIEADATIKAAEKEKAAAKAILAEAAGPAATEIRFGARTLIRLLPKSRRTLPIGPITKALGEKIVAPFINTTKYTEWSIEPESAAALIDGGK